MSPTSPVANPIWSLLPTDIEGLDSLAYDRLEQEVVPEFYSRDATGIPTAWVARMRESMARLTPRFSADRAVREYTELHYLPAAAAYRARAANGGGLGRQIVLWRHAAEQHWPALRFGAVTIEAAGAGHAFEVQVFLGDLEPEAVRVEFQANRVNGAGPVRHEMTRVGRLESTGGGHVLPRAGAGIASRDRLHSTSPSPPR